MTKQMIILIIVVAVATGIIGYMIAPKPSPDQTELVKDHAEHASTEIKLQKRADSLTDLAVSIHNKRLDDSKYYLSEIEKKEKTISILTQRLNAISLENASTSKIDSIRLMLYGGKP